jgi:hypothetical protein
MYQTPLILECFRSIDSSIITFTVVCILKVNVRCKWWWNRALIKISHLWKKTWTAALHVETLNCRRLSCFQGSASHHVYTYPAPILSSQGSWLSLPMYNTCSHPPQGALKKHTEEWSLGILLGSSPFWVSRWLTSMTDPQLVSLPVTQLGRPVLTHSCRDHLIFEQSLNAEQLFNSF